MTQQRASRFWDRKTECWNYPKISVHDNAWDGGSYLDFLDDEPDAAPLRIYVHIPFCKHFCAFCPYYKERYDSVASTERMALLDAMVREIEMYAERPGIAGRTVSSIYFGGGDPAVLSVDEHMVLWQALRSRLTWSERVHISVEGTATSLLDEEKLRFLAQQGTERVSFGIQTFDAETRHQVNLRPTHQEITMAIDRIAAAGIADISVDMIYNFPGQDEAALRSDVYRVTRLPVTYVDFYSLSLYPNTGYMQRVIGGVYGARPTPDSEDRLCRALHDAMVEAGHAQVSAVTFSRLSKRPHAGFEHTLSGGPTLAIGPSARSYIDGRNYRNHGSIRRYVADVNDGRYPVEAAARFSAAELENWPYVFFPIRLSLPAEAVGRVPAHEETIRSLISDGYVVETADGVELSAEGRVWAGNIQRLFFSDDEREKERRVVFESLRQGVNPYNEDRMGTPQVRNLLVPRPAGSGSGAGRRRRWPED